MKQNTPLVWIDLEMTGLDAQTDHILEIATLITDAQLNIIEEGPELVIHQSGSGVNNSVILLSQNGVNFVSGVVFLKSSYRNYPRSASALVRLNNTFDFSGVVRKGHYYFVRSFKL